MIYFGIPMQRHGSKEALEKEFSMYRAWIFENLGEYADSWEWSRSTCKKIPLGVYIKNDLDAVAFSFAFPEAIRFDRCLSTAAYHKLSNIDGKITS